MRRPFNHKHSRQNRCATAREGTPLRRTPPSVEGHCKVAHENNTRGLGSPSNTSSPKPRPAWRPSSSASTATPRRSAIADCARLSQSTLPESTLPQSTLPQRAPSRVNSRDRVRPWRKLLWRPAQRKTRPWCCREGRGLRYPEARRPGLHRRATGLCCPHRRLLRLRQPGCSSVRTPPHRSWGNVGQ